MYRFRDVLARTPGYFGFPWARDLRDPIEGLSYDEGVRMGRRGGGGGTAASPGEPETFGGAFDYWFGDSTLGRVNRFLTALGLIGGLGYGAWQAFTLSTVSGLGAGALTVLKWTAIGTGAGAVFLMALAAAASIALLWGIFMGLGLLLNFLAG